MNPQAQDTGCIYNIHQYIEDSPTPEAHTLLTWTPPAPPSTTAPRYWIIYIHGGAWWRPMIDASSFALTADSLLSPTSTSVHNIAGLASLNYRLSAPPPLPQFAQFVEPQNPARNVKHPAHLNDVEMAIAFLQTTYGFGNNYVVVGHSCGATLTFQLDLKGVVVGPKAVLGVEGIYDMRKLVKDHDVVQMYRLFTQSAFGTDEEQWDGASPAKRETDGQKAWELANVVAIAQSEEDELVDSGQAEVMWEVIAKLGERRCNERIDLKGKHDEVWREVRDEERGTQLGTAIERVLESLMKES